MLFQQVGVVRVPETDSRLLHDEAAAVAPDGVALGLLMAGRGGDDREPLEADRLAVARAPEAVVLEPVLAQRALGAGGADESGARARDQFGGGERSGVVAVIMGEQHEVGALDLACAQGQRAAEGEVDLGDGRFAVALKLDDGID